MEHYSTPCSWNITVHPVHETLQYTLYMKHYSTPCTCSVFFKPILVFSLENNSCPFLPIITIEFDINYAYSWFSNHEIFRSAIVPPSLFLNLIQLILNIFFLRKRTLALSVKFIDSLSQPHEIQLPISK